MVMGAARSMSRRARPWAGGADRLSVPAGAPTPKSEKNFIGEVTDSSKISLRNWNGPASEKASLGSKGKQSPVPGVGWKLEPVGPRR
jgi:hypothetical protein